MTVSEDVCQPEILDTGRVLDQDSNTWISGFQNFYKTQVTETFINNLVFDDSLTSKLSEKFLCAAFRKFTLLIDLAVTLTPTDILIEIFVSDDGSNFYKLMNGPFGDIRYEDSAGDKMEAIQGEINAPYMKVKATATGTDATNKFTLTAKVSFTS